MTKISSLAAMAGADVDTAADLLTIADMSEAGAARNKKMTLAEFRAIPDFALTAAGAIAAGNLVNIHSAAGAKIRKANATDATKPANGFVLAAIADTISGGVFGPGRLITGLAGLTPGATYYLDTAAGGVTDTPPAASGNIIQEVGVAISATVLLFAPKGTIEL